VSVVITTYNTGRYLPETLESVFAQSHAPAEVIVVDDGSADDSVARAREFGDRVRSIPRAHEGLGPARNAGVLASTGDHLAFLDSDDLWSPEALKVQLEVAARHPESGLIVADGFTFGVPGEPAQPLYVDGTRELFPSDDVAEVTGHFHREFVHENLISCPAQTLMPRWVYDSVGPVCATPNGPQDYDYYLRVSQCFPITFHRAALARWRLRDDSMSGALEDRRFRWTCQSVCILAHARASGTAEAQAYVDAAFEQRVRRATVLALEALADGRRPDPDDLDLLYRAAPRNPSVVAARSVSVLPSAVRRGAARGVLASWRGAKRIRSRGS
jgi:glycosyltransferase involved in cell wall biosynthesis